MLCVGTAGRERHNHKVFWQCAVSLGRQASQLTVEDHRQASTDVGDYEGRGEELDILPC